MSDLLSYKLKNFKSLTNIDYTCS